LLGDGVLPISFCRTPSSKDTDIKALPFKEMGDSLRGVVLAGGETNSPLTRTQAMPALSIGSSLRLVDIPIANCIFGGIEKMYCITQYASTSLNVHVAQAYPPCREGWVDLLVAQQTPTSNEWYRGSADALRSNVEELRDEVRGVPEAQEYVVMSG
jgi:glucose-1-phosphate adenylyltransferase